MAGSLVKRRRILQTRVVVDQFYLQRRGRRVEFWSRRCSRITDAFYACLFCDGHTRRYMCRLIAYIVTSEADDEKYSSGRKEINMSVRGCNICSSAGESTHVAPISLPRSSRPGRTLPKLGNCSFTNAISCRCHLRSNGNAPFYRLSACVAQGWPRGPPTSATTYLRHWLGDQGVILNRVCLLRLCCHVGALDLAAELERMSACI